jgi:flagellar biosynthesis protein FlhB
MMQEVPKADVVITNPTHYAVALKYDEQKMDAPVVIAKGVDYVALKIKEIAKEHDIVTVENRPLARALYSQAEIGDVIPEEFFKSVAEILAYVYRLKNKF